jgi:hypothetical protein
MTGQMTGQLRKWGASPTFTALAIGLPPGLVNLIRYPSWTSALALPAYPCVVFSIYTAGTDRPIRRRTAVALVAALALIASAVVAA